VGRGACRAAERGSVSTVWAGVLQCSEVCVRCVCVCVTARRIYKGGVWHMIETLNENGTMLDTQWHGRRF